MGHHGAPIVEVLSPDRQVAAICELLPSYGHMQLSTSGLVDGWIAVGVPDRRAARLADQFELFLEDAPIEPDLTAGCIERLRLLRRLCLELDRAAQPATLEHADMHGTNVVTADGRARLIDWGDCCITHPFTAIFVPIQFVVASLPQIARPTAARRMRDCYLEAWGGPTSGNLALLDRALAVAPLVRVLSLAAEVDGDAEIDALLRAWVATQV